MKRIEKILRKRGHSDPRKGLESIEIFDEYKFPSDFKMELTYVLSEARDSYLNSAYDAIAGAGPMPGEKAEDWEIRQVADMERNYEILKQKISGIERRLNNPNEDVRQFLQDFEKFNNWCSEHFGFFEGFGFEQTMEPQLLQMFKDAAQAVGFSSVYY